MWKERHASARGYGEINARVIYFSVSKHYCSSLAIIGKREYSLAVPRTVRWRKRGWFGGCYIGKPEYLASCTTYGSLTKTVVVRWLFLVFGIRYFWFWVKQGGRAGEMWWLFVAFELLVCVDVLTLSLIVEWPWYYGRGWKNIAIVNITMIYYCRISVGALEITISKYGNILVAFSLKHRYRLFNRRLISYWPGVHVLLGMTGFHTRWFGAFLDQF